MMTERLKIKVCGMRDGHNIQGVSRLKPDYMGFIFYQGTPRFVGEDFVIPDDFPEAIGKVGVFVSESSEIIIRTVERHRLDYVQLHGNESAVQCRELKERGIRVIKAFSVDGEMDFKITGEYQASVDYFLFDTKGKFYGGNARTFNWDVLSKYDQKIPFFLSGGIRPEHIETIKNLKGYNIMAIDVNSGVEVRPAFKDLNKIKAIQASLNFKM